MKTDVNEQKGADHFLGQVQAKVPVFVTWKDGKHVASRLLAPEENTKVFELLGNRKKALAMTVAQVWFASPNDASAWSNKLVGVLCFVKDFTVRSHFIRMVTVSNKHTEKGVIWEQEIYKQFHYHAVTELFHTFEGDKQYWFIDENLKLNREKTRRISRGHFNVGLNFCDKEEAAYFEKCIKERIDFFLKKRAAVKAKRQKQKLMKEKDVAFPDFITNPKPTYSAPLIAHNFKENRSRRGDFREGCLPNSVKANERQGKPRGTGDVEFPIPSSNKEFPKYNNDDLLIQFSNEDLSAGNDESNSISSRRCSRNALCQDSVSAKIHLLNRMNQSPSDNSTDTMVSEGVLNEISNATLTPQPFSFRYEFDRSRSKAAMKIAERQKEYHSSMIRSLVMSRYARMKENVTEGECNRENNGCKKRKETQTISEKLNDEFVNGTPENRAKGINTKNIDCDGVLHCPKLNPSGSIINGPSNLGIANGSSRVNGSSENLSNSGTNVGRRANESYVKKEARKVSRDVLKSSTSVKQSMRALSDESSFSFPSLPSLDKLKFSTSVQLTADTNDLRHGKLQGFLAAGVQNGRLFGQGQGGCDAEAGSTNENENGSNIATNVLDMREELMKSIIAGKTLRKVDSCNKNLRKKILAEQHFEEMTDALSKAIAERNRAMNDSSSDECDNYGDDGWDDEETET